MDTKITKIKNKESIDNLLGKPVFNSGILYKSKLLFENEEAIFEFSESTISDTEDQVP